VGFNIGAENRTRYNASIAAAQVWAETFWRTPGRPVALDLGAIGYWDPRRGIGVAGAADVASWLDLVAGYDMAEATDKPVFALAGGPQGIPSVGFTAGNSDHLSNADSVFDDFESFSMSAWIAPTTGVASGIIAKGDYEKAFCLTAGLNLRCYAQSAGGNMDHRTTAALTADVMVHVAVSLTSPASGGSAFYIDGVAQAVTEVSSGSGALTVDATSDLFLGLAAGGYGSIVLGPVAYFDRPLSAAEVMALANEQL